MQQPPSTTHLRSMPGWSPPSDSLQRAAIGIRTAPKDLQAWLQPSLFPDIPEPDEDDWPRGKGQTLENNDSHCTPMPASTTD